MGQFADKQTPLHFIRSQDAEGKDCFFFLQSTNIKTPIMQKAFKNDAAVDLTKYGTIIASGFGNIVPQETIDMLVEELGYDAELFLHIND
jgi:hypothetical protein